jgi:hypothetical protein
MQTNEVVIEEKRGIILYFVTILAVAMIFGIPLIIYVQGPFEFAYLFFIFLSLPLAAIFGPLLLWQWLRHRWIRFTISDHFVQLARQRGSIKQIQWPQFSAMKLRIKGSHIGMFAITSRNNTDIDLRFLNPDDQTLLRMKFHFRDKPNAYQLLHHVEDFANRMGKQLILKTDNM